MSDDDQRPEPPEADATEPEATDTADSDADSPDADEAEIARLKAERDELAQEVDALRDRPASRHRTRKIIAAILVIVSVLSLAGALPALWVRRSVTDEDRYLSIVGPLPSNPAVAEALSRELTTEVFSALHVQERLSTTLQEHLPEAAFLAGPITSSVQTFTQQQVRKVLQSPTFDKLWIEANTVLHESLIDILRGDSQNVSVNEQGEVVLNLLPAINQVLGRLSSVASDLAGHTITLPTITQDMIPSEAITKIEATLGVDLPDNFGQIVLFQSDALAALKTTVQTFDQALFATVAIFFIALIAAIWVSPHRRRTILQLSVASAVIVVIERRVAFVAADKLVEQAHAENRSALRVILDAVIAGFRWSTGWVLAITFVVFLVALLSGPYGWAVKMRSGVARFARAAWDFATGPQLRSWAGHHRDGLMIAGAVVGVLVLLVAGLSFLGFLIWVVLLALYEAGVYAAGAQVASSS